MSDVRWSGNIWDALGPEYKPESELPLPPRPNRPLPPGWPAPPSPDQLYQDFQKRALAAVTNGGSVDPFGPAFDKWLQAVTRQVLTG